MGLDVCLVNIYPPLQYHTDVKILCAPPIHPFRSHDYSLLKVDLNLQIFVNFISLVPIRLLRRTVGVQYVLINQVVLLMLQQRS